MKANLYALLCIMTYHVNAYIQMNVGKADVGYRQWDWSEWSRWSKCTEGEKTKQRRPNLGQLLRQEQKIVCGLAKTPLSDRRYGEINQCNKGKCEKARHTKKSQEPTFPKSGAIQMQNDTGTKDLGARNQRGKFMPGGDDHEVVGGFTLDNKGTTFQIDEICPVDYDHFFPENGLSPPKGEVFDGSCYRMGKWGGRTVTQEQCRKEGANLVSIETEGELNHLKATLFAKDDYALLHAYWTSGQLQEGQNKWRWSATGEPVIFTNWIPGQPSFFKTNWKFIAMESQGYGWYVAADKSPNTRAVCEVKV